MLSVCVVNSRKNTPMMISTSGPANERRRAYTGITGVGLAIVHLPWPGLRWRQRSHWRLRHRNVTLMTFRGGRGLPHLDQADHDEQHRPLEPHVPELTQQEQNAERDQHHRSHDPATPTPCAIATIFVAHDVLLTP